MGKILSLVDRLRIENKKITYELDKFPIFEGKVVGVVGKIILHGETCSLLDYVPKGQELPKPNFAMIFSPEEKANYESIAKQIIQRVVVPFSVDSEVVNYAMVKGHIKDIKEGIPAYVLEVLRDESVSDAVKSLSAFAGEGIGSKYEGFLYIVPLGV